MDVDQARRLLLLHSYSSPEDDDPRMETGFMGSLRPYRGLIEENYHEVIEAIRTLDPQLQAEQLDREIISALWAICFLSRYWALEPDGMLQRSVLITAEDAERLHEWLNAIGFGVALLLDGHSWEAAFPRYRGRGDACNRRTMMADSSTTSAREAIETANQRFMQAFADRDAAGMAALYTGNGQLLPPNSDFVAGAPAIQAFWQAIMDMGIKAATLETVEVEGHGESAYEVGRFTLYGDNRQTLDQGKYIVIWKREGEQWKLHRDIWNSSRPAG